MTTPTVGFTAETERGGRLLHTLFEVSVSHPTPATWYLATADVELDGQAYQGLVEGHGGVAAAAVLGGLGGASGVALTLTDTLGTGGPGRRFSDVFATPVPGYGEPYDLLTATLVTKLVFEARPTEALIVGSALYLQPDGYAWTQEGPDTAPTFQLTFGPDQRRYHTLPRATITTRRYPHAPEASIGQPIAVYLGRNLRVPLLALDPDGGLFLIGASPADTPLSAVSKLWTIRPEPGADESTPTALPVQLTTGGQTMFSLTAGGTDLTLTQAAQRIEIDGDGFFAYGVSLRLKRASGGTPCVGSITVAIRLDNDGLPGEDLVDPSATAEVDAQIVTSGTYADYVIPFQANNQARAVYIPGQRGVWVEIVYAQTSGGMRLEVDNTGAYVKGILATKATATDETWKLTGRQQRRGPVRQDFTGVGYLLRADADGAITTRPPVRVRGL